VLQHSGAAEDDRGVSPPVRRPLTAALVSAALIAAVSGVVAVLEPGVPAQGLGVLYLFAVVPIALVYGLGAAVVVSLVSMAAFNYFFLPPRYTLAPGTAEHWSILTAFLVSSLVVSHLAARSQREARRSARLADEQAALRRVATLVARGVAPPEAFGAVTREVGLLLAVDATHMARFEADGAAVEVVASWTSGEDWMDVGTRLALDGESVSALVQRTGAPARMAAYEQLSGPPAALARQLGVSWSVGAPIVVDQRLWGVMIASSKEDRPLPPDAESRIAAFTELAATAISNTENRAGLARLADEQAALRRVATLVARGSQPDELFAAVVAEIARLLPVGYVALARYESDGTLTTVAGGVPDRFPVGSRWPLGGRNVSTIVYETGRPARIDSYSDASGELGVALRERGFRASVGTPVVVEGRLWGVMTASARPQEPLPADTEPRLASFTELVATAISNTEARMEVAASRARIVAAADEERRRVVRDLHDGAQQRLIHTIITLKLAHGAMADDQQEVPSLVTEALDHAEQANVELRELVHGILPTVLTKGGLRAGVTALASRTPVPVDIDVSVDRLPAAVEAAAYFVVAEALTNVAKHSRARHAEVTARIEDGTLAVRVRDDGAGGAAPDGSGLVGLADRLAALDGELRVDSPPEGGTLVAAAIPLPG
jgi:signal transduction histidine kinase